MGVVDFFTGLNHPWVSCGHDFGPHPPAWRGAGPTTWNQVESDLIRWRAEAGVTWSRWWLIAGGVNYPVGVDPDTRFDRIQGAGGQHFALRSGPPQLGSAFERDFEALLRLAIRAGVKLVPSLLSFEFFFPIEEKHGAFSGGRGPIVFGGRRQPLHRSVDAFLDATLQPLLEISRRYRDAVGAWEVVNEPDWVVSGGPLHARFHAGRLRLMPKPIAPSDMCVLLERALDRITAAGFMSTIGFKQADPRWLGPRLRRRLIKLADSGQYMHQLHHYPSLYEPGRLALHDTLPIRPCIVGEMATAQGRWGMPWRRTTYLERRLRIIRDKGYPGALLWSGRGQDAVSDWGPAQWAQVRRASS